MWAIGRNTIVTILGPRQAGKTTLAKSSLPHFKYVNLEVPETRVFAQEDPKTFLRQTGSPVILDEIQRAPELLSYIQAIVDASCTNGQFVLTGSHQLELRAAITQSLAGRTGLLHLLPLSIQELQAGGIEFETFEEYAYRGFLPRIYDQKQRPTTAYSNYYQTYVERDVRQLIQLKDAAIFEKFIKLLAGRVGQLVNIASLAGDVGVTSNTVNHWLSILEASFVIFKLAPYFENFGKRVVKSPKYYFTDVGLLVFLLGIEKKEQITRDPLVGSIFENMIVIECLKAQYNRGRNANLYFFRDSNGVEADLMVPDGRRLRGVEIKSGATFQKSMFKNLDKLQNFITTMDEEFLVYSGESRKLTEKRQLLNFREAGRVVG